MLPYTFFKADWITLLFPLKYLFHQNNLVLKVFLFVASCSFLMHTHTLSLSLLMKIYFTQSIKNYCWSISRLPCHASGILSSTIRSKCNVPTLTAAKTSPGGWCLQTAHQAVRPESSVWAPSGLGCWWSRGPGTDNHREICWARARGVCLACHL